MRITKQVLLKHPCPFCQDVWAIVTGTPRKREQVKCRSKGHLLLGVAATTRMTYKEIVHQFNHPNPVEGSLVDALTAPPKWSV